MHAFLLNFPTRYHYAIRLVCTRRGSVAAGVHLVDRLTSRCNCAPLVIYNSTVLLLVRLARSESKRLQRLRRLHHPYHQFRTPPSTTLGAFLISSSYGNDLFQLLSQHSAKLG